jgi:hypothetical protein
MFLASSPTGTSHPASPTLTIGAAWTSLTGTAFDDSLLAWPPDAFAFAASVIERAGIHRFAVSSPAGTTWPPPQEGWNDAIVAAGRQWGLPIEAPDAELPSALIAAWRQLAGAEDVPLGDLSSGRAWTVCEALLTVHAIADEACAGLGITLDAGGVDGCLYRAQARELLARTGSLARIAPDRLRVLPRVRTSSSGTTAVALARYACVVEPSVDVRWHKLPTRRRGLDPQSDHVNILLLPWPLRIRETDFQPLEGSVRRRESEPFGLFAFTPAERLDLDLLDRTLRAARDEVDSVDVVYMPEAAVDVDEVDGLEAVLDRHGVVFVSAGVRGRADGEQLPVNRLHIGVNPRLDKGLADEPTGEPWIHLHQNKHHRWSLDESQIYQYHLGGALHPSVRWSEAIDVPRSSLTVLEVGEGVVVVYLVCEDLARSDDVAEVVRRIGPTVVTTHVLDGPQLASRWGARYASVLADDPGSAVLTLTSHGMVERSRPRGFDVSPVIAMWKDPIRGIREIPLEPGAHGVLLTGVADTTNRRSSDGRAPVSNGTHFFDVAIHQVHAAPRTRLSTNRPLPLTPELEAEDLTVLTSWAEALAEVLDGAPERAPAVLSAAGQDAPWRDRLGVPEASDPLRRALDALRHTIDQDASGRYAPRDDGSADGLADRVLRYAVEARAARKARRRP